MSGLRKDSLSEFLTLNRTATTPGSSGLGRGADDAPIAEVYQQAQRAIDDFLAAQSKAAPAPAPVAAEPAPEPAADRVFAWLGANGPASPVAVLRALGLGATEGAEAFALLEGSGLVRRETVDGAVRLALAD
jgi:hypothetical protein